MTDAEFRTLLDLWMVSDPWPLDDNAHSVIEAYLDRASIDRGFPNWVVAYHEMPREELPDAQA